MFTDFVPFAGLPGTSAQPGYLFHFAEEATAIDKAFAASQGKHIRQVSSLQRLPNGQVVQLSLPQMVGSYTALNAETAVPESDFSTGFVGFPDADLLCDLELEIYLRTEEERIIDLLDFSEISEEADEDGYMVGYVALAHLIRHRATLQKYGVFLLRTGPLRAVSAATQQVLAASAA
ncbi:hypothetical protein KBK19_02725 [Microvirga sp. STR05]|uniref:Uncharacterized protein n=1 Tax=Hymenobacter duratus TaxID=2771356 RepID=A0ABR8JB93_9BACT|nr:hypothetical protein [Hymenobacter duratus]MBD2713946.1 hypothetical protein [Hymenobacter duratus]MBR7948848.1 hypothetical protein [Microvirga sp. STR05]